MDFAIGGLAAVGAGLFTNPLEVLKTRMQLQGELQARGKHAVHYRNVFHAGYVIAKHDGVLALQAGLVPALWFQLFINGIRLGCYTMLTERGFMTDKEGNIIFYKSVFYGGICGTGGAFVGSPLYLVKTHLQARAAKEIAFGHQHDHGGMIKGITNIYKSQGFLGLFRGSSASLPRAFFGSTAQLTSFDYCKQWLHNYPEFRKSPLLTTLVSSLVGGVAVAVVMTPFDLVSTRIYNQGVDAQGKGLLYRGYLDCVWKIWKSEGFFGFYKGLGACYFRLGPHTVLCLVFWDQLKEYYNNSKNMNTL